MKLNAYLINAVKSSLEALQKCENVRHRDAEKAAIAKLVRRKRTLNTAMRKYEAAKIELNRTMKVLSSVGLGSIWADGFSINDEDLFRKAGGEPPREKERKSHYVFLRELTSATPMQGKRMLEKIGVLWE